MSKNKETIEKEKEESKRGAVGGQAVLEGVMMKSKDHIAIAVRRQSGEIVKKLKPFKALKDKHKILNIPIIRGFVNFIEMMKMSMSTLNESAEMLGLEEEEDAKDKKKAQKTDEKGEKKSSPVIAIASVIGTVLGLALSFGLFFFLPTYIGDNIIEFGSTHTTLDIFKREGWFISLIEGLIRILIFVVYILLVTLIPDIKRTFQYHGAEHMSVFCYEAEKELTVENARKFSRFHPRCGTSFLIVMMIIGIIISMFIPDFTARGVPKAIAFLPRLAIKLSVFPIIIGIGFEFIKFAGKHDSIIVKILSAPGLWIQRLSTKKPTDQQLEVAVVSLRAALKIDAIENENVEIIHGVVQESPVIVDGAEEATNAE